MAENKTVEIKRDVTDVHAVINTEAVTHRKIVIDNSKDKNENSSKFILHDRKATDRKDMNFL